MSNNCAVILAAGEGTRMKSKKPKALAEVLFKPMIDWVADAAVKGGAEDICVVTGHGRELLEEHLGGKYQTVVQSERLGTGHAVMQAKAFIEKHIPGNVLILSGDAPLMDADTISAALAYHTDNKNAVTVISAKVANPKGYGRIIRDREQKLTKIVEEKEATADEKLIDEVNSSAYWFDASVLLESLDGIVAMHDKKGEGKEYYLTDAIEVIMAKGMDAVAFTASSSDVVLGANDRAQLLDLNEIARKKILRQNMVDGVSIPCADGVIIGPEAKIGTDTVILPGTVIKGKTVIGSGCTIGPNSWIEDSEIAEEAVLNNVQCFSSKIGRGTTIGPFVRIRPNCVVGEHVKIGNFVELKNANVGDKTSVAHLTYIGDADFGKNINVGCGCATVNYNGKEKFRSKVEDNAFIGCSTYLVAPVHVGKNGYTAAGSVITEDVPENALAIARARQVVKKDWVNKKKPYKWQK